MKTIDFCIPFVGVGLRYTEFLISNLLSTAAHPERISICLSVHSQSDWELIKNASFNHVVKHIVMAPTVSNRKFAMAGVSSSANHCSAIQSLFNEATADVVIFSDYDMAFLVAEWDLKIIKILDDHDLCGVEYPNDVFPITLIDSNKTRLFVRHYQKTPTLSFLAITKKCIETHFSHGISSFHQYLTDGGLPPQIVNTVQMAEALHLPLGTVWWMDSGCEIPFVIARNKLKYQTFVPVTFDEQFVFTSTIFTEPTSSGNLPEVFIDNVSGEPILAHYGRGTLKSKMAEVTSFDCFMAAVNGYLAKQHSSIF